MTPDSLLDRRHLMPWSDGVDLLAEQWDREHAPRLVDDDDGGAGNACD